jgi:hypothetical protein
LPLSYVAARDARFRFASQSGLQTITGETTYTLSRTTDNGSTLTKSATVRIIPTFQEK